MAFFAGDASGCGDQSGVQDCGIHAAGVADRGQPGAQTCGCQPVGSVLAVESGQKAQADHRIDVGEQPDGAREDPVEVFAQLVGQRDAVSDEVFAGSAGGAQRGGGRGVGDQGPQPGAVGAQGIGQHEGVESVVFVAGRAVAASQVFELVGTDHHHRDLGGQQRVDQRAVGAFDGHLVDPTAIEQAQQRPQSCSVVFDGASVDFASSGIDDRDRMITASPVDSAGHAVDGFRRQYRWGILHHSLLAASPSGEAPKLRCRGAAAGSLTVRRSEALSPVDGRHTPGNRRVPQNSSWTSQRPALVAITRRHLGCIGNPSKITDTKMVHQ